MRLAEQDLVVDAAKEVTEGFVDQRAQVGLRFELEPFDAWPLFAFLQSLIDFWSYAYAAL